jgi:hypothetical protein
MGWDRMGWDGMGWDDRGLMGQGLWDMNVNVSVWELAMFGTAAGGDSARLTDPLGEEPAMTHEEDWVHFGIKS